LHSQLHEGKKRIPDGYLDSFELAEKVFLHQRVFDPLDRQITYLKAPDETLGEEAEKYIGQ
jgi:exonuclease 1